MQTPSFTAQDISLFERLARIFYDPQTSFVAVRERETSKDWFAPVVLAVLVGLMHHFVTLDITFDPNRSEFQQKLVGKSLEERQELLDNLEGTRRHSWMIVPIFTFRSLAVVGIVLWFLARYAFQVDAGLREMLVVKGYASMVLIPEWIARTILIFAGDGGQVHTGPGAFVPPEMAGTFMGNLIKSINIFDLWQTWLVGLGFSVLGSVPLKRSVTAVVALYVLWIVTSAAMETAVLRLPPPDIPPPIE